MANAQVEAIVAIYRLASCKDEFQRQIYQRQAAEAVNKLIDGQPNEPMTAQEVPNLVQTLENQTGPGPDQAAINREKGYVMPMESGDDLLLSASVVAEPELSVAKAVGKSGGDSKAALRTRAGETMTLIPEGQVRHSDRVKNAADQAEKRAELTRKAVNPDR